MLLIIVEHSKITLFDKKTIVLLILVAFLSLLHTELPILVAHYIYIYIKRLKTKKDNDKCNGYTNLHIFTLF